jgi:hypothetical protein
MLLFSLPTIAQWEEKMFREGTMSWQQAIFISLLFGFVHMLVGVPLCAAIVLSFNGLWLTHWYFVGGIQLSTLHHAAYDMIVVGVLLVGCVISDTAKIIEGMRQTRKLIHN